MLEATSKKEFTRVERARGLTLWLCYQGGAAIWANLVGGMVLTGLLLHLGANDRQIGLLGVLAYMGSVTQLIALMISRRITGQKRWWMISQGVAWALYAMLAIVGLSFDHELAVIVILSMVGIANFIAALSAPVTNSWYMELLSPSLRASFISRQNLVTVTFSIIAGVGIGYLLDSLSGYRGFLVAYGLSVPVAVIMQIILKRLPFYELSLGQAGRGGASRTGLKEMMGDRRFITWFITFTIFFNSWVFAVNLLAPFGNVYYLKVLTMPYSTLALLTAVANLSALLTYPAWGYLINRYGNKPAMTIGMIWAVIGNLALILATPERYTFLFPVVGIGAILSAGHGIAANNMYYGLLPQDERKASYMAFYSTVQGGIGIIAPIIGGYLATSVASVRFEIFGMTLDYLRILFLGQALLYVILLLALRRLKDEGAVGLKEFIGEIRTKAPLTLLMGMLFSSKSPKASTRAEGVKGLGRAGSPLALERLLEALDDSSTEVRREAIEALAELKSPQTVPELIARLQDPEYCHDADIIRALGEIGDSRAVAPIIDYLRTHRNEENSVIEAITALGALGGDEAKAELRNILADTQSIRVLVTTVEALGRLGVEDLIPVAAGLLKGRLSSRAEKRVLMSLARIGGVEREFYRLISLPELEVVVRFSRLLSRFRMALGSLAVSDGPEGEKREMLELAADLLEAYQVEDEARVGTLSQALVGRLLDGFQSGRFMVIEEGQNPEVQRRRDLLLKMLGWIYDSQILEGADFPVYALVMLLSYTLITLGVEESG